MLKVFYKKYIATLCVLLCCFGVWAIPVQASAEDLTLTVDYTYEDTAIADAKVKIYLVAEKSGPKYVLTEQFEELDVLFENTHTPVSWREAGKAVELYIQKHGCVSTESQQLDNAGTTEFEQLHHGVYFVDVEDMPYKNGVLISDPVLITLPLFNNETNSFEYSVRMEPKVAFVEEPEPTKPEPTKPPKPTEPDPSVPETTEPAESTEPEVTEPPESTTPEPTKPHRPGDGDELIDIGDGGVPQTGTIAWLIAPLALAGIAFFCVGIFGFHKKEEEKP